jgi:hypothetical protein
VNRCIKHSYFRHIGQNKGDESCALLLPSGAGPIQIENNHFATAGGVSVFVGTGGGLTTPAKRVRGVLVRGNRFEYPTAWDALGYTTKNFLETKGSEEWLVEGNAFVGYIGRGRLNQWVSMTMKNDEAPTNNVVVRCNDWQDCYGFIGCAVSDPGGADLTGFDVHQNLMRRPSGGRLAGTQTYTVQIGTWRSFTGAGVTGVARGMRVAFNYITGAASTAGQRVFAMPDAAAGERDLQVTDNVIDRADDDELDWFIFRSGVGTNNPLAWEQTIAGGSGNVWARNAVTRVTTPSRVLPGDLATATRAAMGLAADGQLQPGSPALTAAADGGPLGPDWALVARATARAFTGRT